MELLLERTELVKLKTFRHATCYLVNDRPEIMVVQVTSGYIAKTQFQEIFIAIGKLVGDHGIKKLIFDMSLLVVFHQPSMEWFFTVWQEQMLHYGLKTHRKILPNDESFRESVKIEQEKIMRAFPHGRYAEMDIRYCDSLEEAIDE